MKVVYFCKKAFILDRFISDINLYVSDGKIIYVGKDEPYPFDEKMFLGEVWPGLINLDVEAGSFKVFGNLMSNGGVFFLDRSELSFTGVPQGVFGKLGKNLYGIDFCVEVLHEGMSKEDFFRVLSKSADSKFYVKLVDYAVRGKTLFYKLLKGGFPSERILLCNIDEIPQRDFHLLKSKGLKLISCGRVSEFVHLRRKLKKGLPLYFGSMYSVVESARAWYSDIETILYNVATRPSLDFSLDVGRIAWGQRAVFVEKINNELKIIRG